MKKNYPSFNFKNIILANIVISAVVFMSGCSQMGLNEPQVVVWDSSHRPVFGIDYFKDFVTLLGTKGLSVRASNILDYSAKCLIIAGGTAPFTKEESDQLYNYVENGGKLLILTHIPPKMGMEPLLNKFGFNVSDTILIQENQSTTVSAEIIGSHPLTNNVKELMLFGCYYIISEGDSIVKCNCYADKNKDKVPDDDEKGEYGVVGYKKVGKGEVVVVTDDAVLMDNFIMHGDNRKFAENVAQWILVE